MSVSLMSAVFKCNVPELKTDDGKTVPDSTAKFVLLALADNASDEGEGAYPGIDTLCQKTNFSTATVCNALNALRHNGFTVLIGKSKRETNNYTILVAKILEFQWLKRSNFSGYNPSVLAAKTNPSINHPLTTNGAKNAPQESPKKPMPIEWQIASGNNPVVLPTADEEFRARVDLAVMGVARYGQDLAALADAFISTRKIFPGKKDLRGWAGVLREMKSQGVTAEHITQAVNKLVNGGMTVADPWAVKKTALDMANKIKVEQPEPENQYHPDPEGVYVPIRSIFNATNNG